MDRSNNDRGGALLTRAAVRKRMEDRGLTVTEWAIANGFSREQVYAFLAGRTKGKRGTTHRLAIALGVKAVPIDDTEMPKSAKPPSVGRHRNGS